MTQWGLPIVAAQKRKVLSSTVIASSNVARRAGDGNGGATEADEAHVNGHRAPLIANLRGDNPAWRRNR